MIAQTALAHKRPLTSKQELFCQQVATGHNLTDSYRVAYDAGGMKDSSVHRKASELHGLPAIRSRIEELARIEEQKSVASRIELLQIATMIARGEERATDRLKAVEILSRMQGFDAPSQSVSVSLSVRRSPDEMREILRRQVDFSDLDLFKGSKQTLVGGNAAE